ncbi:hypothetical protein GG681_00245 [Epibacterium sp. SM1969]|uniref:Uncharacterized protein n=1 Tax=Tritonibacter aquimaris TaxID=2663379 RepID=A0A844AJR0_9RHOB|nr:hypothetical protein [Tritonibacter aquimaris]MQY41059.1 hypothetical protein [Tritonibacter aquimaris]
MPNALRPALQSALRRISTTPRPVSMPAVLTGLLPKRVPFAQDLRRVRLPKALQKHLPREEVLSAKLVIPVQDKGEDEAQCDAARGRGVFLARQERWEDLTHELMRADTERAATGAGLPIADLLAFGARSDVVNAVDHALEEGTEVDNRLYVDGIMALEAARLAVKDNPLMAAFVAQAHLDLGWAWRGAAAAAITKTHESRAKVHFDRAWSLVSALDNSPSPFVQSTRCSAQITQEIAPIKLADGFAQLIALDPINFRNMRHLGIALRPALSGEKNLLEIEARRAAVQSETIWGSGGYTWTYLDALMLDDTACETVDLAFFMDGLRDILHNRPAQETVNLLLAFCAIGVQRNMGQSLTADAVRMEISHAADWLARYHLQEIHPLQWAHAAAGFANNAHVPSPRHFAARGRDAAQGFLQECFSEELAQGQTVSFSDAGLEVITG